MDGITTHNIRSCPICGQHGRVLFTDLPDRLHKTPWRWSEKRCTGRRCGTFWLDPQPSDEEVRKLYPTDYYTHGSDTIAVPVSPLLGRFHDYLAGGYLAAKYGYQQLAETPLQRWLGMLASARINWKAWVDDSVMRLPHVHEGRCLDIGFGSGRHMRNLERLGWRVSGCDQDSLAVTQARSRGRDARLGTLQEAEFRDVSFDAVIVSHVIEHVSDPSGLLRECFRILAPGGFLSLTTPNIESLGYRLFGEHWVHLDVPRHLTLLRPNTLRELLSQTGFEIDRMPGSLGASSSTGFQMSLAYVGAGQRWANLCRLAPSVFGKLFSLTTSISSMLLRKNVCEEIAVVAFKPQALIAKPPVTG